MSHPPSAGFFAPAEYEPRNLIAIVTRVDSVIEEPLCSTLKTAIHRYVSEIRGPNNNVTVQFDERRRAIGFDYDHFEPVFIFQERHGRVIENTFQQLIERNIERGATFDLMLLETDPTEQHAVTAWHCKGMMVSHAVPAGYGFVANGTLNVSTEASYTFQCTVERGPSVLKLATQLLKTRPALPEAPAN